MHIDDEQFQGYPNSALYWGPAYYQELVSYDELSRNMILKAKTSLLLAGSYTTSWCIHYQLSSIFILNNIHS